MSVGVGGDVPQKGDLTSVEVFTTIASVKEGNYNYNVMIRSKAIVAVVGVAAALCSFAENWYVSETGDDNNDGKSWETAFRRLTKPCGRNLYGNGIATAGDTVWVEDGYECSAANGDSAMGVIPSTGSKTAMVIVQAGVTLRSRSGDWRTGAVIRGGGNLCLCLVAGASAIGFQCMDGGSTSASYGGVYGTDRATCVVSNCLVTACSTKDYYKDICNVQGAQIYNCVITNNVNTVLHNCDVFNSTIANGTCSLVGGYSTAASGTSVMLDHCVISNFVAEPIIKGNCRLAACELLCNTGVLVQVYSVLDGCTISGNWRETATEQAKGLIGGGCVLSNCTLTANTTRYTGTGGKGFTGGCLFGSDVRAVNCRITQNTLGGVYTASANYYGVVGENAHFENCFVADNSVPNGGNYIRSGTACNSVFVHTNQALNAMCLNTKLCNVTIYGNCRSYPGATTNSICWNVTTGQCGDPASSYIKWTEKPAPVNSCSARAADDTTGTSFSTAPGLDMDITSRTFLMPLKNSPCIDKCTGDYAFAWMTDPADPRSKDVYRHRRVIGAAADIGALECCPAQGLQVIFR